MLNESTLNIESHVIRTFFSIINYLGCAFGEIFSLSKIECANTLLYRRALCWKTYENHGSKKEPTNGFVARTYALGVGQLYDGNVVLFLVEYARMMGKEL
jgi:hypothetical protein